MFEEQVGDLIAGEGRISVFECCSGRSHNDDACLVAGEGDESVVAVGGDRQGADNVDAYFTERQVWNGHGASLASRTLHAGLVGLAGLAGSDIVGNISVDVWPVVVFCEAGISLVDAMVSTDFRVVFVVQEGRTGPRRDVFTRKVIGSPNQNIILTKS